ncbi:hypothetical protein [Arthrobacter sp. Y-9]|uniref:hypothetical protein n=1 Tax=Arthrobacter sp. Y-9 TaxID=3039385 RepID=UPI00241E4071|nr:hypothetical protein [Arthrobacter sp. Y-9]WFR84651.1 hypothetical protein P9849_03150 [Arthrobacter sp. Y-9]
MNTKVTPAADIRSALTREAVQHMKTMFNPKSPEALRQDRHAAYMSVWRESFSSGTRVVYKRNLATGTITGMTLDDIATVEWDELAMSNTVALSELVKLHVDFKPGQRVTHTVTGDCGVVVPITADMVWLTHGGVPVQFDGMDSWQGIATSQLVREEDNFVPVVLWEGVKVYHGGEIEQEREKARANEIRRALRPLGLRLRKNSGRMPWQDGYGTYNVVHAATGRTLSSMVHLDDVLDVIA